MSTEQITTQKKTLRSGHHDGTYVTGKGLTLTEAIRGETGKVELVNTTDQGIEATIEFKREYENPVVVAYIITRNNDQSIEARVKNVTSTNCVIFTEEPDDQSHSKPEYVGYIILESGSHITDNGYRIEAGIHTTEKVRRGGYTDFSGDEIKFNKIFTSTPVVLHSLNTYNNGAFATSLATNVSIEGFEIAQELAETKKQSKEETIGWIAFEQMNGKGNITDVKGEVGIITTSDKTGVEDKANITIDFNTSFFNRPDIVVKGQTINGLDGYWVRGAGAWSKELVRVYAEEDQTTDKERSHTIETFGYAAFESNSILRSIRSYGERISEVFNLRGTSIIQPMVTTWKTDNYSKLTIDMKYSEDDGISWSDWISCDYAGTLPGMPIAGELDGYLLQFKYAFNIDVEVPPHLTEFTVTSGDAIIIKEGINVGGYATDGSDWNTKRIL